ncbi:hypothetical protein F8M41_000876 [Gigaspora margarita]|uniref:F-box domain-containing protein n=1 Tax=Gigaspora margarita TaxID=4874 RepID=A0A8H4AZ90_GIGMA|nr:hypothetical protein F8M41_000876 [Gigaspora margarita]
MIKLPNECLFEIFINLKGYNRNLFSCLLVNRQWCRNIIPILWSGPVPFYNRKFIRTCLSGLNVEEQTQLIPFEVILSNNPILLFDYTTYITTIDISSDNGIIDWLNHEGYRSHGLISYKYVAQSIKYSLVAMFLRTCIKLKDLNVHNIGCNKIMNLLAEILYKDTTLTSLSITSSNLDYEGEKIAVALCKNTTLTSLSLENNQLGLKDGKALAAALCKNTTLTSLYLYNNKLCSE